MNITVIIPTRNRLRGLCAAITSLRMLESGKHNVRYGIGCDDDDIFTQFISRMLCEEAAGTDKITTLIGPRPVTLGELVNGIAEKIPGDVYTALCDDVICITPDWDEKIAEAVDKVPYGVFWWQNAIPNIPANWAIVTEKWRQAAGSIYTNHYPFWYDDICLEELWDFATNTDCIMLDIFMVDKPVNTMRLRELTFWRDFYTATRPNRVKHAAEIAKRLGLPDPEKEATIRAKKLEALLGEASSEICEKIEKNQGDLGPPDISYITAKNRALDILKGIKAA